MGKPHRSSYIIITFHFSTCHFLPSFSILLAQESLFFFFSWERPLFPSMMIGYPCLTTMTRACRSCFSFSHLHYACQSRLGFSQCFFISYLWSPWQLSEYFGLSYLIFTKILYGVCFHSKAESLGTFFPFPVEIKGRRIKILHFLYSMNLRQSGLCLV